MIDSVTKMMQLCNNNVQKLEKVLKLNRKNLRIVNGVLRNSDCVGEKRRLENYLARIKGLNLHIESKIENEKIGYGNSKKRRNSKVRWIEVKSAFVGRVRTGAVVNLDENLVDIRRFFHDASPLIFSRITNILKKMTAIKLNFEMSCEYIIPSTGEVSLKYFNTPNTMILLSTDIQKSIDDLAGIIQTKMEEFAESKSGWSLRKICQLMVAFNKYTPINGRIYIPLPTELKKKGGIINIMNTDRLCFVWSVLASLYPCKNSNYERTDAYPQNYHDILNLRGVQMPVQLSSDRSEFHDIAANNIDQNVELPVEESSQEHTAPDSPTANISRKVYKRAWSTPEKKCVLQCFHEDIRKGVTPSANKYSRVLAENLVLHNRNITSLKAYINNLINRRDKIPERTQVIHDSPKKLLDYP
ncbi:hypothetical protein Zmor_006789 [Zophobas morio]|uniref:Uncharacterized protein n=1 Tax=Zophobas morio TaxID=2755281 RepID=A0AA38MNL8_9CUCU|nr:hypothetical protein Zmor_006789 [Zophobas morio]